MARHSDPTTVAFVVSWTYGMGILYGVLRAGDSAVRASEEAVRTAAGSGNDHALGLSEFALGAAVLNRDTAADRQRGVEIMVQLREFMREHAPFMIPYTEVVAARERAG